ncbi:MAG: hypothetical protein Q7J31_04835 [Syntrophales bacterium]|nr:hypothetical protein [Syntrophales bacterium]
MTVLGGLPIYLDLAAVMGIGESIGKHLHIKQQSWTEKQRIEGKAFIPAPNEHLRGLVKVDVGERRRMQ